MKKLYCLVFLLFITLCVVAQTKDSLSHVPPKHFMIVDPKPVNKHDKPLIVVDGFIFNGNIKQIDPNDILSVDVLKQPGATNIYGKRGVNGVILISTKSLRNINYNKNTVTLQERYNNLKDWRSKFANHPLYIIDEKPVDDSLVNLTVDKLYPSEILNIQLLKDCSSKALYGVLGPRNEIIILTLKHAIIQYQKRLSSYSEQYKNSLKTKSDDSVLYVVNGSPVEGNRREKIKKLYDLDNISSVNFIDKDYKDIFNNKIPIVVITTKNR